MAQRAPEADRDRDVRQGDLRCSGRLAVDGDGRRVQPFWWLGPDHQEALAKLMSLAWLAQKRRCCYLSYSLALR